MLANIHQQEKQIKKCSLNPGQLFLLQQTKKVVFSLPIQKVLFFCPMFNDTYFLLVVKSHMRQSAIHMDKNGNILKEIQYEKSDFYEAAVLNQKQVAWIHSNQNLIIYWNLQKGNVLNFPYEFNTDLAENFDIFIFPQTKLFAVIQWSGPNANYIKITYFFYPLSKNSQPAAVWSSDDPEQWSHEMLIKRGNAKSMFIWFRSQMGDPIQFKVLDLKTNGLNKYEPYFRNVQFKNNYANQQYRVQFSIANIWELSSGKFFIGALTDRALLPARIEQLSEEQRQQINVQQLENYKIPTNSLFVYDQQKQQLRQSKIDLLGKFRIQNIDFLNFGHYSMIRTFDFKQNEMSLSPIYYIDNARETIAARGTWKCSALNKYTLPGYDRDLLIDAEYKNGNVKQIICHFYKVANPKQISVMIIEELMKNPDEDLLKMVLDLLEF